MGETAAINAELEGLVGQMLVDRYRVDAFIGMGAMGAVFRGHQVTLKRNVAIKILHPELMQDEQIAKRFEREAESAARLEHPNIVQVLEQGETKNGHKFIVMQLLEGGELADLLEGPIPPAQAVVWTIQILSALEHAHAHGVVHRDLKPENVFVSLDHDGREVLKLVDFGIAKMMGGSSEAEPMTKLGLVFGTPAYMSPEQATGVDIDERTDLYSAGIILYQMLSGGLPFENDDPIALIRMQVSLDPAPLPESVPAPLRAITTKLLEKQREARFTNAAEARESMEAVLSTLDLDGLAIPSHIGRDVSGIVTPSIPIIIPHIETEATHPTTAPVAAAATVAAKSTPSRWLPLLAGAGLTLGLVTWLAWPKAAPDSSTSPSAGPVDAAAEAGSNIATAPVDELAEIDRLLLAKSSDAALALAKPLRDRYPEDPQLAWREGRALAMKRNKRDTALVRYGEALEAKPKLIEDSAFYSELYDLLSDRRLRSEALDFAVQKLGKHGHRFLLGLVNEKNPDRSLKYNDRRRALAELASDPKNSQLVDHQLNLARDLWQAPQALEPCVAYRDALTALSVAPAELFLATLRRRGVPKKPADDEDALVCDALPDFRAKVLAAYEAAYGEGATGEAAQAEAVDEPQPAPPASEGSGNKSSGSKKKKKKPLDKMGDRLDKMFGGK